MIRATKDRIIVSPEPPVTQEGRFYVSNLLPSNQGKVVSVGPKSTDVEVGSRISWRPFQGHDLDHDGIKYKVLERDDILLLLDTPAWASR